MTHIAPLSLCRRRQDSDAHTAVSPRKHPIFIAANMKKLLLVLLLPGVLSCSGATADDGELTGPPMVAAEPPLNLAIDFNAGTYSPLTYTTGRTDSPADADPLYRAATVGAAIVYGIPASALRPKLSGFLDLPQMSGFAPIAGNMIHEFSFPNAEQLRTLGAMPGTLAIAGCYMRGNLSAGSGADWTNGDSFGGFWFGFVKNADGTRQSVIRGGNTNLVSETFTATTSVSYRIYKKGNEVELFRKYDGASAWTKVGGVALMLRAGGSSAVLITHVRILNNSDEAATVTADDFKWYF